MKTSLAFETAAADMFNNLDEVMNQLETLDNAIALLHQIGQVHKASGFPLDYFKVRPSAASLVPLMGMGGRGRSGGPDVALIEFKKLAWPLSLGLGL